MRSRPGLAEVLKEIESVAVVGASPKPGKVGNVVLRNILEYGFKGRVYPVNPRHVEILGLKAYPNISSLPEPPDLVVVAVPTKAVPAVLGEASSKGVKLAVVITSGFREAGNEEAERRLREVVESSKLRVVGPNSAGITLTALNLHASIEVAPSRGSVGLAMQSGAMGGVVMHRLRNLSSGVSFFISLGNMADVSINDVFEYALEDGRTEALVAYVEWVKEGRRFIELGGRLAAEKPLCILKGGRGGRSSEAVRSHTGGLAGNYAVFREAVRKIGAYLAEDVPDLVEVCEALRRLGSLPGKRVLIVTNSGGLGVVTASRLEEHGLEIPRVPEALGRRLAEEAGKTFTGSNPVDFGGDASIDQVIRSLTVEEVRRYYDVAVFVYVPTAAESASEIAGTVEKYAPASSVPLITYFDGEGCEEVARQVSKHAVVVTNATNAAKAIRALVERGSLLKRLKGGQQ